MNLFSRNTSSQTITEGASRKHRSALIGVSVLSLLSVPNLGLSSGNAPEPDKVASTSSPTVDKDTDEELKKLKLEVAALREQHAADRKEWKAQSEETLHSFAEAKGALEAELKAAQAKMKEQDERITALNTNDEALRKMLEQYEKKDIPALNTRVTELTNQNTELAGKLATATAKTGELDGKVASLLAFQNKYNELTSALQPYKNSNPKDDNARLAEQKRRDAIFEQLGMKYPHGYSFYTMTGVPVTPLMHNK